jgi:hypothetical protein
VNALALATALLLLGSALAASAEAWDPADVAEAKRLQAEEAARAAEYRRRVARGDIRAESAPMPREAPQRPDDGGEVETLGDFFDRLFRRAEGPRSERGRSREELRREQREKRRVEREPARDAREADDWWEEEERRMRGAR